jgi:hypothetical protein
MPTVDFLETSSMLAKLKGWARYKLGLHRHFYPFGFAMNGQTARLETVREILFDCKANLIIETGTFRGTTTEWFAQFNLPVISIEAHAPTYEFAKHRLRRFGNVTLKHAQSEDALAVILPGVPKATTVFIYLDAHWHAYLPLQKELNLISKYLQNFVVLIDDFQVAGDNGYGFDDYGDGNALTMEYLHTCGVDRFDKFYPAIPSNRETGARRGWIVIAGSSSISETLARIPLLRAAQPNT